MIGTWRLSEIQQQFGGELRGNDVEFVGVSTDTRSLKQSDLFIVLQGEHFDGHQFVSAAEKAGAVAAVVTEWQDVDIPQWKVADGCEALGWLAAENRRRYQGCLIAVTGSCGKTSVKEMLATVLSTQGEVLATSGNFNNHIGAPLTLLRLTGSEPYAVIELGASAIGEIAYTAALANPNISLITNAAAAHLEGFGSLQGVVKAKGEIYSALAESGIAILNLDDPAASQWKAIIGGRKTISFSLQDEQADIFIDQIQPLKSGDYQCRIRIGSTTPETITLPMLGRHNVANAAAVAAAASQMGLSAEDILTALGQVHSVSGRSRRVKGRNGITLVDDCYNANPTSVRAAIDALAEFDAVKTLVLGDMAELGEDELELHRSIGRYAVEKHLDRLLTVGVLSEHTQKAFVELGGSGQHFENQQQMINYLQHQQTPQVIWVKGSRSAKMENIVEALMLKETN